MVTGERTQKNFHLRRYPTIVSPTKLVIVIPRFGKFDNRINALSPKRPGTIPIEDDRLSSERKKKKHEALHRD